MTIHLRSSSPRETKNHRRSRRLAALKPQGTTSLNVNRRRSRRLAALKPQGTTSLNVNRRRSRRLAALKPQGTTTLNVNQLDNGDAHPNDHSKDANDDVLFSQPVEPEDIHEFLQKLIGAFHSANTRANRSQQRLRETTISGMSLILLRKGSTYVYQSLLAANLYRLAFQKDASIKGKSLHEYLVWRCSNDLRNNFKDLNTVLYAVLSMPYHVSFRDKMVKVMGKDFLDIILGDEKGDELEVDPVSIGKLKLKERLLVKFCKQVIGGNHGTSQRRIVGVFPNCKDLVSLIKNLAREKILVSKATLERTGIKIVRSLIEVNSPVVHEFIRGEKHTEETSHTSEIAKLVKLGITKRGTKRSIQTELADDDDIISCIEDDCESEKIEHNCLKDEGDTSDTYIPPFGMTVVREICHDIIEKPKRRRQTYEERNRRLDHIERKDQSYQNFALELERKKLTKRTTRVMNDVAMDNIEHEDMQFSVDGTMDMKATIRDYVDRHPKSRELKLGNMKIMAIRTCLVSNRFLKDVKLLGYNDTFKQKYLCVEEPWNTYSNDTKEPLPAREISRGFVKRFVAVKLPNSCFFIAKRLKEYYHYLANEDDAHDLIKKAMDSDITVTAVASGKKGLVVKDDTIRIMASGNKCYDEIFSDVQLDVHEIVDRMLSLANANLIKKDSLRGTIAIDIGFGSRHYGKMEKTQEKHSPEFIGFELKVEKSRKKECIIHDQSFFYRCLHSLLPKVNEATLLYGDDNGQPLFPDDYRRQLFGKRFSEKCGCDNRSENNFEAVTFQSHKLSYRRHTMLIGAPQR